MQNSTLHVKITPDLAKAMKALSHKRQTSVGELVRQALHSCYQLDLLNLAENQRRAVEAYRGGYISLGKLAEEMGVGVLKMREWLEAHEIPQNNSFVEDDVKNA